jgi:hypothetical protein
MNGHRQTAPACRVGAKCGNPTSFDHFVGVGDWLLGLWVRRNANSPSNQFLAQIDACHSRKAVDLAEYLVAVTLIKCGRLEVQSARTRMRWPSPRQKGPDQDRRFWCFMGRGEAAQRAYANFGLAPAPAIAASERTLYAHCSSCMEAIEREALSEEAIVAASMCAEPMRTAA